LGDARDTDSVTRRPRQAHLEGFDLHANVWVLADDQAGLERLCRYILRPPFAQERLRLRSDGHIALELIEPIRAMRNSWSTACKRAGVPGRLLHDLRRTAVRNLERAGISRSVTMKMTGHKTESVYRRYAIVSEGDLREAGLKLAASRPGTDGSRASK
jgi:integrase